MLNYLIGNVLEPVKTRPINFIVHCVNNEYKFGSGVAGAIAQKWPHVRERYLNRAEWGLGDVQYVKVDENLYVVNLCGQRSTGMFYETIPVRYESIQDGFITIREHLRQRNIMDKAALNMPRIGCGRAKGSWQLVQNIIEKVYNNTGIEINIYTLPEEISLYEENIKTTN